MAITVGITAETVGLVHIIRRSRRGCRQQAGALDDGPVFAGEDQGRLHPWPGCEV